MAHRLKIVSMIVFGLLAAGLASAADTQPSPRPNVVLILTDDQGYGDLHCHGNDKIDTPTLDRLSTAGARFDRFMVSPLCAPTRSALLTGRYHTRVGVSGVTAGYETMRLEEITLADVLKAAGYATGLFGKWHNGEVYPYSPRGKGFDEFFGFCGGGVSAYFNPQFEVKQYTVACEGFITDVLTNSALKFIERNRDKPFFCYVPYNAPHSPLQVPDKYYDKYRARGLDERTAAVYGMVENIDDNVARLLTKLDELELAENTIVVFLSDNGPSGERYNAGMRGKKGSADEGGVRVPCFVRWPKRIRPGTLIEPIAAHIDMLPTLAEACGAKHPKPETLDGRSLMPLLTGKVAADWPARKHFEINAVRTDRWRLVFRGKRTELFDMIADPGQKTDVAAENRAIVDGLSADYAAWHKDVIRGQDDMPPPLPVGHADSPRVQLRTHLAKVENIERNTPWTNGYLKPWTTTDALVTWQLDVQATGDYDVSLIYVCPKDRLGAKVKIEACGRSIGGTVDREADPTPVPTPDRVKRGEADVRHWQLLPLGTIKLERGKAALRFSVTEMPGPSALEMQGLLLEQRANK